MLDETHQERFEEHGFGSDGASSNRLCVDHAGVETVLEATHDAVLFVDPVQDRILGHNRKAAELLEYSEGLEGMRPSDVHPEDHTAYFAFARSVMREGRGWTNELTCITSTGKRIPAEISAVVAGSNDQRCVVSCVRPTLPPEGTEELNLLQRHSARLQFLRDMDHRIAESVSPQYAAQSVATELLSFAGWSQCSVVEIDTARRQATVLAAADDVGDLPEAGADVSERFQTDLDRLIHEDGYVISKKSLGSEDTAEDRRIQRVIQIPLRVRRALVGALNLGMRSMDDIDEESIETSRDVADMLSLAIAQRRIAERELTRRRELETVYRLAKELVPEETVDEVASCVAEHTVSAVGVTTCVVLLASDDGFAARGVASSRAGVTSGVGKLVDAASDPFLAHAGTMRKSRILTKAELHDSVLSELAGSGAAAAYVSPIGLAHERLGYIVLYEDRNQRREAFNATKRRFTGAIADFAAGALRRARLHEELQWSFVETVMALSKTVDARDQYTGNHSELLARLAERTAVELGCDSHEQEIVRVGALLHDIGKLAIPDRILQKPRQLEPHEWEIIRRHPDIGADILQPLRRFGDVIPIVRYHQERWDGTGYPQGLAGTDIPLGARIVSVVDSYSAITDARPYKPARPTEEAWDELRANSGSQFDPGVVDAFLRMIPSFEL